MIVKLKKDFVNSTASSAYRKWTVRSTKTATRVRSVTTEWVGGNHSTQIMFCDFPTWEAAYIWFSECVSEDLAKGWIRR